MNTTITTAAPATYLNKEYYDKQLLETTKTRLVHAMFGQKKNIPSNRGKRVEWRKWNLFDPNPTLLELEEGITPVGQHLSQSKVEAEVKQYGAYVEISDLLDMTAYDDVIGDSVDLLGEQLGTCVDWVTRDAMCATTNVQYAAAKTQRSQISPTEVLTVNEIRKAVRTLKKNKARMFTTAADGSTRRPHFVCICSPDATYDLQSDSLWQDVSKYSNAEQIYAGEIGRLFGVVFVESTEAKVYKQSFYGLAKTNGSSTDDIPLKDTPSKEEAAYLVAGNEVTVGGTAYEIVSYNPTTNTLTIDTAISFSANDPVYTTDAGKEDSTTKKENDVHATLVFGADAYGTVDIDGSGDLETIIKPRGSEGSADPLNQRSTVGAKVAAYAAKVLQPLWIVRIEHGVSA